MMDRLDYLVNIIYGPLAECAKNNGGVHCAACEVWVRDVLSGVLDGRPIAVGANQMCGPHGPICSCGSPGVRESGSCLDCPPPSSTIL